MYTTLLQLAFPDPAVTSYLTAPVRQAESAFRAAATGSADQAFRFEQWRLGLAMSLLQLVADLGDQPESRQLVPVLHRALSQSRTPADIDRVMQAEGRLFDALYDNLYVNEQGEQLLNLFARTLDADQPGLLEGVAREAVALVPQLDFERDEDDEE